MTLPKTTFCGCASLRINSEGPNVLDMAVLLGRDGADPPAAVTTRSIRHQIARRCCCSYATYAYFTGSSWTIHGGCYGFGVPLAVSLTNSRLLVNTLCSSSGSLDEVDPLTRALFSQQDKSIVLQNVGYRYIVVVWLTGRRGPCLRGMKWWKMRQAKAGMASETSLVLARYETRTLAIYETET
jgi:hypothetical protein